MGLSSQKIVKIEEIDKLSSQAQVLLKDGLMEKYQETTTFLATTNYPEKLDPALRSRFNTQINFDEPLCLDELYMRLQYILESESIIYQETQLKAYIDSNSSKGLREMINDLELASVTGTLKLDFNTEQEHHEIIPATSPLSSIEKEIIRLTTKYDKSVLNKDEMATELGISVKTLDRHIKEVSNIPSYLKLGKNKIIFPIRTIAEFLCSD